MMNFLQYLRETAPAPLQTILLSLLFVATLLVILQKQPKRDQKTRKELPPGPSGLPIIGSLLQLGSMPPLSLMHLSQIYGPLMHLKLGEIPTIIVSSASMAKEVLKTHDLALSSRPPLFAAKTLFYNCSDVVFSPYGSYWRHIRKICILELLSARRVHSYSIVREQEAARLVRRIAAAYPKPVSVTKKLGLYSNDVLCRVAFGRDFSEGGEYDKHGLYKMLEAYQVLLGGMSVEDFFPSMEWISSLTRQKKKLDETFGRFDRFIDEIIEEHRDLEREKVEYKDLVGVLLDIQKNDSLDIPLTTDNIKAVILDMFAAGTDTTFITLDWGMTELIMHPRVMKRAQDEVRGVVGERSRVLESDIHKLPYLRAVIKEIFRLHPPAPLLVPRESMEEVIIDGYRIPAKARFFVNAWAIGRDPVSWENPNDFNPDRFMGSSIDYKGQDFELIPFGAGRRGCPALTFGEVTTELALAQLLHSFDWELPPGIKAKDLDMTEVFGITMHRVQELMLVAKPCFA